MLHSNSFTLASQKNMGSQFFSILAMFCLSLLCISCSNKTKPDAAYIIEKTIQKHGGTLYQNSRTDFTFRSTQYTRYYKDGLFRYARSFQDSLKQSVYEAVNNDSTWQIIGGKQQHVADSVKTTIYESINSVIYFGFLPFKLRDPAVNAKYLGTETLDENPYHEIEVTFDQEKGGIDHQDRFIYWIHTQGYTLDYLAYHYENDGGGARFRVAYNRRNINGMIIQDYRNYRAEPSSLITRRNIQQFDSLYRAGQLTLVSTVDLNEASVQPL